MKDFSAATKTELSGDFRDARLLAEIDFPSGKVRLTTGDPAKLDTAVAALGTVTHGYFSAPVLTTERARVTFPLGDSTFISDFLSTALKGKTVKLWSYYEFTSGLVGFCDLIPEHSGLVSFVRGGTKTASIESIMPRHIVPRIRYNPSGGFNWVTTPKVITLNRAIITVQRAGLR